MSYILEALKRSQQQRELGHVPTLAGIQHGADGGDPSPAPWARLAVTLAVLALAVALYGVLGRTPAPEPDRTSAPEASAALLPVAPEPSAAPAGAESVPAAPPVGVVAAPEPPAGISPPPPERLPDHPAPERAVEYPGPTADARDLPPGVPAQPAPPPEEIPQRGILPGDLVDKVREFERRVLEEDAAPASAKRAPAASKERPSPPPPAGQEPSPPKPPPAPHAPALRELPADVQLRIGSQRMSVHVFAEDPANRFVILNAGRLREGERSPDGVLLEQILPDGAVLEAAGSRFFLSR